MTKRKTLLRDTDAGGFDLSRVHGFFWSCRISWRGAHCGTKLPASQKPRSKERKREAGRGHTSSTRPHLALGSSTSRWCLQLVIEFQHTAFEGHFCSTAETTTEARAEWRCTGILLVHLKSSLPHPAPIISSICLPWSCALYHKPAIVSVIIGFSCQVGTRLQSPGKREPPLKNCFNQIGLWPCL